MFETCREYGLPKPELVDFDGDFRVNMYRKRNTDTETSTETSTKTDREIISTDTETILRLMKEEPAITAKMIAKQLELSASGVRYHQNKEHCGWNAA